jgi:thiamine pyrophosphokinase
MAVTSPTWLNQAVELSPEDLLIAADGGAQHCLEKGLHPAYVVGDLDSLDSDQVARLESQGAQFVRYPSRKDQTDLELAVDLAQNLGYAEVLILGALGARWDQTIANIMLPAAPALISSTAIKIHSRTGEQISCRYARIRFGSRWPVPLPASLPGTWNIPCRARIYFSAAHAA